MNLADIGGGVVRRTFTYGSGPVFAGHKLSREQILGMPAANRAALIDKKYIELFIRPPGSIRFISQNADGSFDVIEGRKINEQSLTKAQAHELAGALIEDAPKPAPAARSKRKAKTKH